jgi:F-type H+-transporting ATPase subunit delta
VSSVGRRYAEALYDTLGTEEPERVLQDLDAFASWLQALPALRVTIENPGIPYARKVSLIRELTKAGDFREISGRFVLMVVANRRIRLWGDLVEAFRTLHYQRRGIQRARVVSARPLDEARLAELQDRLARALAQPVELESNVSEALVGGLKLHVGSTVYDGSVAGALESLRQALAKG